MTSEHIRAFREIPGVVLAGIYSRTKSRAEALAVETGVLQVFDSISELYEMTNADIVVISVSELSVRHISVLAFEFPWLCLIEKPAGYNIYDARLILEAAKKHNARAYIALNRRHYSSTRSVMKDLENYPENRVVHVYDQENPKIAMDGGSHPMVVENWMYANSIHVADYLSLLCRGDVVSVENVIKWDSKQPFFVLSKISYTSGDIGIYEAIWNAPGPWAVTITTPRRRWELRPLEKAAYVDYGSRLVNYFDVDHMDTQFKPGLCFQAQEAVNAVRFLPHSLPTLEDGFKSMKLIEKIYES